MRSALLVACLAVALAGVGEAKDKGRGKGKAKGAVVFAPADMRVIVDYYRAPRGGLPPGLEKQLRRNGRLPPGLEKHLVAFPVELERRLPPPPPDCARAFIGAHAVIYNSRTRVVLDVFAVIR